MEAKKVQKLPDPQNMISRVKARMSKKCAVRVSPYCEIIISMRMQGIDFRSIEKWLIEQGEEYRISPTTIMRNLRSTKMEVELPFAEELAEQWGGRIDLDYARELSGQIVSQRHRISKMQRREEVKQNENEGYFDKRIRAEVDTLHSMIRTLHSLMKSPLEAANEAIAASGIIKAATLHMTPDVRGVIRDMLLSGELAFGSEKVTKH